MAYVCLDCSHRSKAKFTGGKCPACDSFNIQAERKAPSGNARQQKRKTLAEYFTLILFWGFLLWGIWDRYLS